MLETISTMAIGSVVVLLVWEVYHEVKLLKTRRKWRKL